MATRQAWVSYRLSLVVAIPLLVMIATGLVAGENYVSTRNNVRELAATLFVQVADQAAQQASSHIQQATPAVDLLTSYIAGEGDKLDTDELANRMAAILRANPGFAWASFGREDGTSTGIRRREEDGRLIISHSHLEANGKPVRSLRLLEDDGTMTPLPRPANDTVFDPRLRPYYKSAVAAKKRVWTAPYMFGTGIPGITCAAPIYSKAGDLRGVVTVDFDLNGLSAFVLALQKSVNAHVFIATREGEILAHSDMHLTRQAEGGPGLVTRETIADPLVREHYAAINQASFLHHEKNGATERYFSATRPVAPDEGIDWYVAVVARESDFLGKSDESLLFSLLVSLGAVVIAVVVALILASRVARPLVRIANEMDRVGRFELDPAEHPPSAFKEISQMDRALAMMKSGLGSFALYVPRDLVRRVLARGETAVLGGETKRMTIFFSDLAGFTSLSEDLEPKELVELLGGYFDEMTKIVIESRGTVDKFIGDGIMAFWNAPEDEPSHARLACEAALKSHLRLEEMKKSDPSLAGIKARIGIATGEVLVGNIGSHERLNYTVMGDTANLASRLEGLGKVYGTSILVGEATHLESKEWVVMRAVDVVAVKGKKTGVRVYEPIGLREGAPASLLKVEELSEAALDAYLSRSFEEAGGMFEAVAKERPGDVAAAVMRDRCREYASHPPSEAWSGVFEVTEK